MTIKAQHFADTFAIFSAIEQHTAARALVLNGGEGQEG
jgi:hypothetical protein